MLASTPVSSDTSADPKQATEHCTLSRWATHPAPVCIWRPQPRSTDAWGISPLVHLTDGYDNNDFQAVECNLLVI